jgi:valyl-tRNA synthetase
MPFITEEIWQRCGPLVGRTGPSIMLEPYPRAEDFAVDEAAGRQVSAAQAIVLGIRQIRGELDVPHSRSTPVYVRTERDGDRDAVAELTGIVSRVANLDSIEVISSEADLPPCAIAIIDGRTVLAPFTRLVDDVSMEIARLEKRRGRAQAERDRAAAKLANERFLANAPPDVVTKERDRVADFDRQIEQLAEQLRRLAAVEATTR